jgi:hypothetical protein
MAHSNVDPPDDVAPNEEQVLNTLHGSPPRANPDGLPEPGDQARLSELRLENADLREAIDSRAVIEQAKGALILRYGLDDTAAFAVLKRWSQSSNTKLHTIAAAVVHAASDQDGCAPDRPDLTDWLNDQIHTLTSSVRDATAGDAPTGGSLLGKTIDE